MSTILKTEFDWVKKPNIIVVYSDHARYFRESLLFTSSEIPVTPHQAIKLSKSENIPIDLRMLSSERKHFVKDILLKNGVLENLIII